MVVSFSQNNLKTGTEDIMAMRVDFMGSPPLCHLCFYNII